MSEKLRIWTDIWWTSFAAATAATLWNSFIFASRTICAWIMRRMHTFHSMSTIFQACDCASRNPTRRRPSEGPISWLRCTRFITSPMAMESLHKYTAAHTNNIAKLLTQFFPSICRSMQNNAIEFVVGVRKRDNRWMDEVQFAFNVKLFGCECSVLVLMQENI